jgi:chemotaxis protein methyltransferase CheR
MTNRAVDSGQMEALRPLAAREFEQIRRLARRTFGMDLKPGKEELVAARLRRLVRAGGFRSYEELCEHIAGDRTGEALAALIDALATNHTAFLRESDHFDFLREKVVPELLRNRDRVELWCAACSTGEEVWTLACVLNEALGHNRTRITATDISRKALETAAQASYPVERCEGMPAAWLAKYFAASGGPDGSYQVRPAVQAQAAFSRLNLMDSVSWPRPFPVIFCRNVMIYFDAETQKHVAGKLAQWLEPGGYLFVGHAESLARFSHSLEYVRPAVYRKPLKQGGPWSKL